MKMLMFYDYLCYVIKTFNVYLLQEEKAEFHLYTFHNKAFFEDVLESLYDSSYKSRSI